jgi:hypothetical protein
MEHMAKAQAGYIRTVNELREKVAELEGNKLFKCLQHNLTAMLQWVAALVSDAISGTDKRTLALMAALAYIAWPRVAPTARSLIKRLLATLANSLFVQSKVGHMLHRVRMRVAAILVSVITLVMPNRLTGTAAGDGQSGAPQTAPVMSAIMGAVQQAPQIEPSVVQQPHVAAPMWAPSLEPIAEPPHQVAPVVGQIGRANIILAALVVPDDCALRDDGATIDCSKTALGRIPGTFTENESELSIGESSATLVSRGIWYHALTRIAADGTEEDGLFQMMDTPTGIATIFSEVAEVNSRRTNIVWSPDAPRTYHTLKVPCSHCICPITAWDGLVHVFAKLPIRVAFDHCSMRLGSILLCPSIRNLLLIFG